MSAAYVIIMELTVIIAFIVLKLIMDTVAFNQVNTISPGYTLCIVTYIHTTSVFSSK